MKFLKTTIALASFLATIAAMATPSADEIKQLGTTLTPWGAVKDGNKEGTIPEWTGVKNPPKVDYSKGVLPDPFPNDKVLFTIDGKNVDKYAGKLSDGQIQMLKRYPTFRLDVYPTRRSVTYPQALLDHTVKNATRCSLQGETLDTSKDCRGGFPFPIPKTAEEVMWNMKLAYMGPARISLSNSYYVKPSGEVVLTSGLYEYQDNKLYDPDLKHGKDAERHWGIKTEYLVPSRVAGQATIMFDALDNKRRAWSYQPSTRRVRLAPDLAGDTPIAATGGAIVYDEMNMFNGPLERWDWKLLGKTEMYIPYNNYKVFEGSSACAPEAAKLFMPNHPNPECYRVELHRVWHVQATLKADRRHVFSKRDFYLDEDTWWAGIQDTYDKNGKIFHHTWLPVRPDYVKNAPFAINWYPSFDMVSGSYYHAFVPKGWALDKPLPAQSLTSESMSTFILKDQK